MNPAKYISILTNPLAGSGRGMKMTARIRHVLQEKQISFHVYTEHWPEQMPDCTDIWIVGGDGTLNYFVNKYPNVKMPLMIFPGGSGNDFSVLLFGTKSLEQMIDIGLTAEARGVDAGICNDRYFINGAGIAFEGAVVEKIIGKNKRAGKIDFLIAILKRVFFYREPVLHVKDDVLEYKGKCLMISVMNGKTSGGGFMVGPKAGVDDGLFEVSLVRAVHPIKRLFYLPIIEKGKHINLPFVSYYRSKEIRIEGEEPIPAHLDGEYYKSSSLTIRILPNQFLFRY